MKDALNSSKRQFNKLNGIASTVKSRVIHNTLKPKTRQPSRSKSRATSRRKNLRFSPLLKHNKRQSVPTPRALSKKPRSPMGNNTTPKELTARKIQSKSLEIVRGFFYNTLRFFELPSLPIAYYAELEYIKRHIKSAKLYETKQIEKIVQELETLKEPHLPLSMRQSLEEFSGGNGTLYLYSAEQAFQSEISKLTAKCLSQATNSPQDLVLSFLSILSEVDASVVIPKQSKVLKEILRSQLSNPGKVMVAVKKLPEAIRTNKISQKTITKAKKLVKKTKASEPLSGFMKELFRVSDLYRLFYCKKRRSKSRCKNLSTDLKPVDASSNPHSTKAAILQQYMKGQCPSFVLNLSHCSENDYSFEYLLSTKSIGSRPSSSMTQRKPLKRANF